MDIRMRGKVIRGASRGKSLGFPTANIPVHKAIEEGIYVSRVKVHPGVWLPSVTFIGKAITFNEKKAFAESFLLDFSGDLYGRYITVELLQKIRENKKFDLIEDLKKQMQEDVLAARKFFG